MGDNTMALASWFEQFCKNILISEQDLRIISSRYKAITKRINMDYYSSDSDTRHSLYIGSFGRDTEIFASDIDMLVELPAATYNRYNAYLFNGQSALLQEVKSVIKKTYPSTDLKGDGQIISLKFSDGINFEVLPTFLLSDNSYIFPDSNGGGSWKPTDPRKEIRAINVKNNECDKNLKRLCRMARAWKNTNNVEIHGITLDIFAYNFISQYEHRDKSFIYYDWLSRDFFKFISEQNPNQKCWKIMGSGRYISDFGNFRYKAKQAYDNSNYAINALNNDYVYSAKMKWRDIYGRKFPL